MADPFLTLIIWAGIGICISQSAMFSGMNLALFSISRLRLEVEATAGNRNAQKLLRMRTDSNFLLTTVLWGNVGVNVLLTLLSNSVLAGISAFLFSTVLITFVGEIIPQAYFSRNALKMASMLSPVFRFYQIFLYPVTKPCAMLLDWWLGKESIEYFREYNLREVIKKHIEAEEADIDRTEGQGALNFLAIDDLMVIQEGEPLDPTSVIALPSVNGQLKFPEFSSDVSDPFLRQLEQSGKKWVILTNEADAPQLVIDTDHFLRHALFRPPLPDPNGYCHRPIVIFDSSSKLGDTFHLFKVHGHGPHDDTIDQDIILLWGDTRRIITGADIFGRLMRGISRKPLKKNITHDELSASRQG